MVRREANTLPAGRRPLSERYDPAVALTPFTQDTAWGINS